MALLSPSARPTISKRSTAAAIENDHLTLATVDLARIGQQVGPILQPVWIEAQYQSPRASAADPKLPEPPSPDRVNHLEYAIEWFAFALIPIVGFPIYMYARRKKARA